MTETNGGCPHSSEDGGGSVERVRGELRESVAKLGGRIDVVAEKLEDVRNAVSRLPRDVADAIRRERNDVGQLFQDGKDHFLEIFKRLNQVERQTTALWVLVLLLGVTELSKAAAWIAALLKGIM